VTQAGVEGGQPLPGRVEQLADQDGGFAVHLAFEGHGGHGCRVLVQVRSGESEVGAAQLGHLGGHEGEGAGEDDRPARAVGQPGAGGDDRSQAIAADRTVGNWRAKCSRSPTSRRAGEGRASVHG